MHAHTVSKSEDLKYRLGLGSVSNLTVALVVALALALVGYGVYSWITSSRTDSELSGELYGKESLQQAANDTTSTTEAVVKDRSPQYIQVHIAGAVKTPGLYSLSEGARIDDAIKAAGGASKDAELRAVNLAAKLTDGEQVVVPTIEEAKSGNMQITNGSAQNSSVGSKEPSAAASSSVNINSASSEQLQTLPGIGPALASRIIADREKNGPFATTSDLERVSGIGAKKLEALDGLVTVN